MTKGRIWFLSYWKLPDPHDSVCHVTNALGARPAIPVPSQRHSILSFFSHITNRHLKTELAITRRSLLKLEFSTKMGSLTESFPEK